MCRNPARMSAPWPARPSTGVGQEWLLRVDLSRSLGVDNGPSFIAREAAAVGRVQSFGCTFLLIFATHAHKSPSWCTLRCGQAANADAKTRIKLFRLAFDAAVSSFSGRQQLCERYYSGDPVRLAGTLYASTTRTPISTGSSGCSTISNAGRGSPGPPRTTESPRPFGELP
jgi:4-hydroxyphenylacetate 3-hydroxylase C terminal